MGKLFLFTLVVFVALLGLTDAGKKSKCEGKKYEKRVKKYLSCLKKGFSSSLGCESGEGELKKKSLRKCKKVEKGLKKCGYECKAPEIDGGWGDFSAWSDCSAECGGGEQSRSRSCNNPAPANGGVECVGDAVESQECNADPCPVDGGWGDFSAWSACSAECGGGTQSRSRSCNNPAPANGGVECGGDAVESQECNADPCPVEATWCKSEGKYLSGYSSAPYKFDSLEEAQRQCSARKGNCGGITFEQGSKKYSLRRGSDLKPSPSKEISWKQCVKTEEIKELAIPNGLAVGDKLGFTATYASTAGRFGFNIEDAAGNFQFRLAFRQANDKSGGPIIVMNSYKGKWGTEIRAPTPDFKDGASFTVTVACKEDKFVAYFNDKLMEGVAFPYRYDLADAAALTLWGGDAIDDNSKGISWDDIELFKLEEETTWCKSEGKYLSGYSSAPYKFDSLEEAQRQCSARKGNCGGITFEQGSKKYSLRRGSDLKPSPSKEISWKQCVKTEAKECADTDLQKDYRGTKATTASGLTCQKWTAQSPHKHSQDTRTAAGTGLGDHNYCRNPDNEPSGAWCYTTDPGVRWKYCGIPRCAKDVTWCKSEGKYLSGYSSAPYKFDSLEEAQRQCSARKGNCGGITFEQGSKKYSLRRGSDLKPSPSKEISWKSCA